MTLLGNILGVMKPAKKPRKQASAKNELLVVSSYLRHPFLQRPALDVADLAVHLFQGEIHILTGKMQVALNEELVIRASVNHFKKSTLTSRRRQVDNDGEGEEEAYGHWAAEVLPQQLNRPAK
jgi:hypothetical protein